MKFSIVTAVGACLSTASAAALAPLNTAVVINNCPGDVYVQSVPQNDPGHPGELHKLAHGKRFEQDIRTTNSTIKIAKDRSLTKPLLFGFSTTTNPASAYYELSTKFGNPFAGNRNIVNPGDGCHKIDCAANDASCYSTAGNQKVYACPTPLTIFAKVCA